MAQISTQLSAVTVYPDRARLTRSGSLALEAGRHTLEIADLPLQMNPDSARAAAHGTARARLLGLQVNPVFYADAPADKVRALEIEIEALQDALHALEAQAEMLAKQRLSLEAVEGQSEVYATALAAGEMSVVAHLALLDGLRARMEKLAAEQRAVTTEKRQVERRLHKLQNELNTQRGARPRQRFAAMLEVEVLQSGELAVELTYVVAGAGWKPLYDVRLVETTGTPAVEWSYLAQITQGTGETWENVALTLSTARPALAGRVPELDPWFIGPPQPPLPQPGVRMAKEAPMPAMLRAGRAMDAAEPGEAMPEMFAAEAATANVDASGAAVTYGVPGHVTIPADNAPHKVTVATFSLPPQLDYVSAPRLVAAAYRRAKLRNDSPLTLLPGPANLFDGEAFIGAAPLELTPSGGEIELYLGVDDRIKIERELKRREVDKRLIGGKRRLLYAYEIKLENHLPVPVPLTLHDQLPVAKHEDIKVRLESAEPRPSQHSELNLLEWTITLAPGEKRSVRFDFSVEHPQGMEVMGIP